MHTGEDHLGGDGDVLELVLPAAVAAVSAGRAVRLPEVVQKAAPEAAGGPAVADHGLEPGLVLAADLFLLLLIQLLIAAVLQQKFGGGDVAGGVEEDAVRRLPVPSGPSRLLVVGLQALGHVVVDDIAHIGFVNAHAEGVGGHHDRPVVKLKVVLICLALLLVQPGVIAGGGDAPLAQGGADLLHAGAGGAVDDAALPTPLLNQFQQGGQLSLGAPHVQEQVGAVETGDLAQGILQLQALRNVVPHLCCGGGGEGGHHRAAGESVQELGDLQIAGAEVLSPLGDAVGLVHGHQRDGNFPGESGKPLAAQALRRDIQQLVGPLIGPAVHQPDLVRGQRTVEVGGVHPSLPQGGHLVLHQRDEGGDHQSDPGQHQSGDLVTQGFSAPGGHDPQNVPPGEDRPDQPLLPRTEAVIAEIML